MRIYVTKYAASEGVLIFEGTDCGDGMAEYRAHDWTHYVHKGEWFKTEEEARMDAGRRIERKRSSLKNQLAKLDSGNIIFKDNTQ